MLDLHTKISYPKQSTTPRRSTSLPKFLGDLPKPISHRSQTQKHLLKDLGVSITSTAFAGRVPALDKYYHGSPIISNSTKSFGSSKLFVDEIVVDVHDLNVTIRNVGGVRPISMRITPYVGRHCHLSVVCRVITRTYAAVRLLPPRSTDGYSL